MRVASSGVKIVIAPVAITNNCSANVETVQVAVLSLEHVPFACWIALQDSIRFEGFHPFAVQVELKAHPEYSMLG